MRRKTVLSTRGIPSPPSLTVGNSDPSAWSGWVGSRDGLTIFCKIPTGAIMVAPVPDESLRWSSILGHYNHSETNHNQHWNDCTNIQNVHIVNDASWLIHSTGYFLRLVLSTLITFTYTLLILILAWISDYMPGKTWNEITCPFPNFHGWTVEVWELITNFIPHFIMLTPAGIKVNLCWQVKPLVMLVEIHSGC